MWATTIKGRCALWKFHVTDSQNKCDQTTSDRRSKCIWSNWAQCIQLILSGSPHECWLHSCNACIITTWWLCSRNKQDYLDQPDRAPNLSWPRRPTQFLEANALMKEFKKKIACSQHNNKIIETNGLTKVASIVTLGWILQRAFCKRKILADNINTFLLNALRRNEETWWWRTFQTLPLLNFALRFVVSCSRPVQKIDK